MVALKKHLVDKVKSLPTGSGVYLFKSEKGKILYVGKAISIRKRVQSYFRKNLKDAKTNILVRKIFDVDIIETISEAEALILEASLIKKHKPQYNIISKDDKSYPYIEVTHDDYPKISIVRPTIKNPKSTYYGPYVTVGLIREALAIIRKIFRFRTCEPFPDKECLDYHIGLCDAPCIGEISKKDYMRNIRHVSLILEGKRDQLYTRLNKAMETASKSKAYEKAAQLRDQTLAIGALYSGTKDINYFKEAEQLQRACQLPMRPQRIEAFDISNIMGNQAVGSMVSFLNGKPQKGQYRRFRIKDVTGIDDYKMMAEVVRRRYLRVKKERLLFPDLIVVDGGKGQLSAACEELKNLDLNLSIISLAKRDEEIFLPGKRSSIHLPRESLGLKLIQRVRDEAHRFAVSYHRKLRSQQSFRG